MRRTPGGAVVLMDVVADGADVRAGGLRAREQRDRARRRPRRPVVVVEAMPAARRAQMLAQELPGLRREQADVQIIPLHLDALADPAGRRAVVRGLDFDAAIEMHRALAVAVIAKRFERQRPERRPLLGKHRGDLALRRAVDARVGPARLPAIEVRLRLLERLEAEASAAASSARGRRRLRLCLCDRDRRRDTAARRRRSARARRDRAD